MAFAKKIIAVYADGAVSTGSLIYRLKETFNARAFEIRQVTSHDIAKGKALEGNVAALFLPGVQDDSRTYRASLNKDTCDKIREFIEDGGTCVGLCAGAYISATRFQYFNKRTGVTKVIHSPLALFDGEAFGPIAKYTNAADDTHQWANHAVPRLEFNKAAGHSGEGRACYALGPWLELSKAALADPDYKVLARYADVQGNPIAIASRKIGRGKAIFCGVLPEISGADIPEINTWIGEYPKNIAAGAYIFARELAQHEPERKKTWNILISEIKP